MVGQGWTRLHLEWAVAVLRLWTKWPHGKNIRLAASSCEIKPKCLLVHSGWLPLNRARILLHNALPFRDERTDRSFLGFDQRSSTRVNSYQTALAKQIQTEDPEMKRLVLSSLMLVALGAGSVLAAQNANKAKPAAKPAAAKKAAPAAAASNTGGAMKSSGKKHHRKHRKHHKKA